MIHKYIPYSAYQVKTANCRQPIQAPLKYIMQEQQVVKLMARSMAEHEFKLWVSNGWILKLWLLQGYRTRNLSMYSIPCHWGVMFNVLSAEIHLVEWIRKNISYRRVQFSSTHYCVQWFDTWWIISRCTIGTHVMNHQQMYYWYSRDELSADVLLVLTWWIVGQMYWKILIATQKRWD